MPEKISMLNNRIKNLSAICAEVLLGPELGLEREDVARQIGSGIRIFNSICQFGILSTAAVLKNTQNNQAFKIVKNITSFLEECNIRHVPAEAFITGWQTGAVTAQLLASTSTFLIQDQAHKHGAC